MSDLYLYGDEEDFQKQVEIQIAQGMLGIRDEPVQVTSWNDLATKIRGRNYSERLGLNFHSFPGGMTVGGQARELSEPFVRTLFWPLYKVTAKTLAYFHGINAPQTLLKKLEGLQDKEFNRDQFMQELAKALDPKDRRDSQQAVLEHSLFEKPGWRAPRKARNLSFVGCNVGRSPTQMVAFGNLLGAQTVSAYTWWMITHSMPIILNRGSSEAMIESKLSPYRPYVVGTLPAPAVLKVQTMSGDYPLSLLMVYGSDDGKKIPNPLTDRKFHKPWREAIRNNITASKAKHLEEEYNSAVAVPFELVTVTL